MVCKKRVGEIFDDYTIEQLQNSKKELGEDEGRMNRAEELLYEWFKCETHLPKNYEKTIVRNFLRGAKYDIEKTKQKLENYYYTRYTNPELYGNWDPNGTDIVNCTENLNVVILPKLTQDGSRISYYAVENGDKLDIDSACRYYVMMFELSLMRDFPISNDILIFNGHNFTANHMVKFIQPAVKNIMRIFITSYCVRIKEIHVINAPTIVERILAFVKPIIPEKIRDRFIIHKSPKTLLNYLSADVLPSDVGGNDESVRCLTKKWHNTLLENKDWLKMRSEVKTDQPPKNKRDFHNSQFQEQIGVAGSFRRLTID